MVAMVKERLAASKERMHSFQLRTLNLKKLKAANGKAVSY
jgi:hypothetical protein